MTRPEKIRAQIAAQHAPAQAPKSGSVSACLQIVAAAEPSPTHAAAIQGEVEGAFDQLRVQLESLMRDTRQQALTFD